MADRKRPDLTAIFQPTEPDPARAAETPAAEPERPRARGRGDRVISMGVGLRESEVAELASIAAGLGVTRNALAAWALRHFLAEYRAGQVTVPVEHETTARLQE